MSELNEESFAVELKGIFLTEAWEMLDDMEAAIIDLETDAGDMSKIDRLLRLVHTIKGSAMVVGFTQLGGYAHIFEGMLDAIRGQNIPVSSGLVDGFLSIIDTLRTVVDNLRNDSDFKDDAAVIEKKIRTTISKVTSLALPQAPAAGLQSLSSSDVQNLSMARGGEVAKDAPSLPIKNTRQRTILVCDDEPEILEFLQEILEREGYQVLTAADGNQALAELRKSIVDVILTDLMMPQMDGIQFIREVRRFNQWIPIVFISAYTSREHFKTYVALGVDEFIEKPFTHEQVLVVAVRTMKARIMRESVLMMSRLCFRAYVSIQKIETLSLSPGMIEERKKEKEHLDRQMDEMKAVTTQLLSIESDLQKDRQSA